MKKFATYFIALLAAAAIMSACGKQHDGLFDKTASARLKESLDNMRSLLTQPEYGWRMEYFAGNNKADYGGYNYVLRFTADSVYARFDLDPSLQTGSLYRLTSDDGPVLSFDTYSEVLHYFAIPGWNKYEGRGGDFEFLIISATEDEIVLQGKRSGKTIRMFPLEEPGLDFITRVHNAFDNFVVGLMDGSVNGAPASGSFDLNDRQVTIAEKDASGNVILELSTAFIPTEKGIKFYSPVDIASVTIDELWLNPADYSITSNHGGVKMKGYFPEDYLEYEFFAGDYSLQIYGGMQSARVKLVPSGDGIHYTMEGLSDYYNLDLTYSKAKGRLLLHPQKIGEYNAQSVYFAAWALDDGGRTSRSEEYGMEIYWYNVSRKTRPVLKFSPIGTEFPTDSFLIVLVDTEGRIVSDLAQSGWDPWGDGQLLYMYQMVRI